MKHKRINRQRLNKILAPLIVVALVIVAVGHIQAVSDYVRLLGYQPPADVANLAAEDTLTDYGRKLFYVNHPEIADKSAFNAACSNNDEQTIVLGCYHPVDRGIFIYAVTDARLDGVEQVTAAHEMLHAAYDRLSSAEKQTIDTELKDFYNNDEHDQRIRETIDDYQKSEPNDVVNEMHSIFGTEVGNLPAPLESYYKRYFSDRTKVVRYADAYQQEFTTREDQVKTDDAKLQSLKSEIDSNEALLNQQQADIDSMRQQMESEKSAGNVQAYNTQVPVYNNKIDRYNALVHATQQDIGDYNQLVSERNSLVVEVQQLTQSISSQPAPIGQ